MAAEGAPTDAFYVLVSGRARLVKQTANGDEIALDVLRAGDSFGEAELLEGAPRLSTVRASSDVLALRLDAADFRELAGAQPDIRTARTSSCSGSTRGFRRSSVTCRPSRACRRPPSPPSRWRSWSRSH